MRNWSFCHVLWALCVSVATVAASDPPKVHLIATGGTIAFDSGGALSASELGALSPEIARIAELAVEDHLSIGSTRMTPELQFGIAERVNDILRGDGKLAGIVITHGTDSLEETAFLLDLLVHDPRPVVVAAAMRAPKLRESDAARNLVNAVRLAASGIEDLGVVVAIHDEIHAARDARKTHTIALDAFSSPGYGPIGYFDGDDVFIARKPLRRLHLDVNAIEPRVGLVRLYAGSDGSQLRSAVASGDRGVVVEVFGRGNVPPKVMVAVKKARQEGVVIVFAPRTGGGRVVLGEEAKRSGVISAEDVDGLKARLVLVAALATTRDTDTLRSYYERLSGKLGAQ